MFFESLPIKGLLLKHAMKAIEIPDLLYARLEAHATFEHNTPAAVIAKWADIVELSFSDNARKSALLIPETPSESVPQVRKFDVLIPPNLTHTRAWGTFGRVEFRMWNDLVRVAHAVAFDALGSYEALSQVSHAKIKKGDHTGEGYKPVANRGFSIQNLDSLHAWRYSFALAKHLKTPIHVNLEWLEKEGAQYPGEKGLLSWSPP
ncbi:MAG: hypothetical protein JWO94_2644 [Verrucomicrobiaceae bacterium]|nr:hypothetical protein [Verrucomicrobiaceae bacterium]